MSNMETLIFLHIPKTAGTTLNSILQKKYKEQRTLKLQNDPQSTREFKLERFLNSSPEELEHYQLIFGHGVMGLHRKLKQEARYISLIRDPVDRVISIYNHILQDGTHWLNNEFISNVTSLEEFIENPKYRYIVNNFQTREICGSNPPLQDKSDPNRLPKEEYSLEEAMFRIDSWFHLIGPTEKFDDFLYYLNKTLWTGNLPKYKKLNRTKKLLFKPGVSREIIAKIERLNQCDFELYQFVNKEFHEKLKTIL